MIMERKDTLPKNQSVLDGFQAIENIAENLNTKLKDLKGATALKIVREEGFKSFSIEKIAQANFTLLDKALDEVISQLFNEFPELLYVTCGVCTEEYNDQNDLAFNTVVFGFVPECLREIWVGAIRNFKEDRINEVSDRERLYLESQDLIFRVMESSNNREDDDEVVVQQGLIVHWATDVWVDRM